MLRMSLQSADEERERQHPCIVSIPTHEHDTCLHLFKFLSVTHFSFKSSISFVTFVPFGIIFVVNISVFKLNFFTCIADT